HQVGDAPDGVILHLAALAIRIDDLPEQADQVYALLFRQLPFQLGGEAEEIDRLALRIGARSDQGVELGFVQSVELLEAGAQRRLLDVQYLAVRLHHLDAEPHDGDPRVIGGESRLAATGKTREKL